MRSTDALRDCLHLVSTWLTRLWLADRPTNGTNRLFATLASEAADGGDQDPVALWKARAAAQRRTKLAIPDDDAIRAGIENRKAYGGGAGATTKAILAALMEDEQRDEAPARDRLTVEHILPQTLTDPWRADLGEDAERLHAERCQTLPNLTLIGHDPNAKLGTLRFGEKRDRHYAGSAIAMTRRLAEIQEWDEAALDGRAEDLARRACTLWEWSPPATPQPAGEGTGSPVQWRLDGGPWHGEPHVAALVLNAVAEILDRDPANADRMLGMTYQDLHITGTTDNRTSASAGSDRFHATPNTVSVLTATTTTQWTAQETSPRDADSSSKRPKRTQPRSSAASGGSLTAIASREPTGTSAPS